MAEGDGSANNLVARNMIRTFGSECFNVKENAHDNVFEDNTCSDNTETVEFGGSNIELRGYNNVIRNNTISDSAGLRTSRSPARTSSTRAATSSRTTAWPAR